MVKTPKGLYNKIRGMMDSLSTEDFTVVEDKDALSRELTVINRKSNDELTISFYPGSFQGNYHFLRVHNSAKDNDKIYTDEPRLSPEPWCREHCCTLVLDYVEEFIKSKEKSCATNPTSLTSLCENVYKRILDTGYNKARLTKSPNAYEIQLSSDDVTFSVYFDLYNSSVSVTGLFYPSSDILSKLDKDIFTEFKDTTGDLSKYEQKLMKNIMIVINNVSSKPCYKEFDNNSNSRKEYTRYKIVKHGGGIFNVKTVIDNIDLESAEALVTELNGTREVGYPLYEIVKQPA